MSIVGRALGTTTSEVAIYKNGQSTVIKNLEEGDSTIIPSVVLIEGEEIKVGVKANNQRILKSKNIVVEVKRLIGSNEKIEIDGKEYTPIEISSMILKRIKEIAEFYLGESVEEAVITVPANFNDTQRKETQKAGELAGFRVDRIINEPTAAAIAYGINKLDENSNILVYDFGGGTLDVTVLELYEGVLDVKASRGNNNLGGKDIDKIIMDYIQDKFYKETGISLDIENPRIISTLKNVSEECKKSLSFEREADIIVPYICIDENNLPLDLNMTIKRDEFELLIKNIIDKSELVIDEALQASQLQASEIDKVIMVGGSTRMNAVKEMINSKFGMNKIVSGISPDETVAMGAAIQGAIKSGIISKEKKMIVTDACSYTLGVEVFGNKFDPIILRDSKLPAMVTKQYKTVEENQQEIEVNIYQGESEYVRDNFLLDKLNIDGIPKGKRGEQLIDITFGYDLNGILDVSVKLVSTGQVKEKIINSTKAILNESIQEEVENEDELEVFVDDGDYTNIYGEVVNLVQYINTNMQSYDKEIQDSVKESLQELLGAVKGDEFKKCRILEGDILRMVGLAK